MLAHVPTADHHTHRAFLLQTLVEARSNLADRWSDCHCQTPAQRMQQLAFSAPSSCMAKEETQQDKATMQLQQKTGGEGGGKKEGRPQTFCKENPQGARARC